MSTFTWPGHEATLPDAGHGGWGTAAAVHRVRELRYAATDSRRLFFLYSDQKPETPKELGVKTD